MLFDVRLLAFDGVAAGVDPADGLVRVFGLEQRAARNLLRRLPHVVKRGVTEEGAKKLVLALERIGARTEVVAAMGQLRNGPSTRPRAQGPGAALPAPAQAALATFEGRAVRDQAAPRAQANALKAPRLPPEMPRGRAGQGARESPALDLRRISPEDEVIEDSLEADIGMPSNPPESMLERTTLAALPRASAAHQQSALMNKGAQAAVQATRGHATRRDVAVTATHASAVAASPGGRPDAVGFRVALPQQVAQAALSEPPQLGPTPITMSQPMSAANVQRSFPPAASASRNSLPAGGLRTGLPVFAIHGPPVEATSCIVPQSKWAIALGWLVVGSVSLSLTVLTLGLFALVSMGAAGLNWLTRRRTLAAVRASALPIGLGQLPELYACLKQFALRLGFSRVPRMYLMAQGSGGLRALTDGPDLVLILEEQTLLRFIQAGTPHGLSALLAHELARQALGHHSWARRTLAHISPRVAYLDLVSADSVALALVSDRASVKVALLSLLGAGSIITCLDHDELDRVATNAAREPAFWSTRFGAQDGFVLARLYHLQRGYV